MCREFGEQDHELIAAVAAHCVRVGHAGRQSCRANCDILSDIARSMKEDHCANHLSTDVMYGRSGVFDGRYKLVRYFGLGTYNRPASVEQLLADNDVALYDLSRDPEEMDNLADPANPKYSDGLLSIMNDKLNALIDEEIGEDKALFTP